MSGTTFITRARVRRTMADEWHSLPADDVLRRLDASPLGLNASDAARRLARIGPNELVRTARISPWRILLAQFVDVLVIVLIIAAIISAVLGTLQGELADLYDAILIVAIVIMNAILGFVQEYRAERSLESLKGLAAPMAHVLRGGGIVAIPSRRPRPAGDEGRDAAPEAARPPRASDRDRHPFRRGLDLRHWRPTGPETHRAHVSHCGRPRGRRDPGRPPCHRHDQPRAGPATHD